MSNYRRLMMSKRESSLTPYLRRRVARDLLDVRDHVETPLPRQTQAHDAEVGISLLEGLFDVMRAAPLDPAEQPQRPCAVTRVVRLPEGLQGRLRLNSPFVQS